MAGNAAAGNESTNAGAATTPQTTSGREISFTVPQLPGTAELMEPKHLLWFGGLALAGVVGVLEWPVVAAVGIGSYVAERFARSHVQGGGR